jgi:hypothetical protein
MTLMTLEKKRGRLEKSSNGRQTSYDYDTTVLARSWAGNIWTGGKEDGRV